MYPIGFHLLLLCAGLALLVAGGDLLVRGASALADRLGIHPLVIGLTVVAFGTSAPELSINLLAAVNGNTEISFGNIIGSNIVNIGLVIGIAAVIKPLAVQGVIIMREIPMMVLASVVTMVAGSDYLLRSSPDCFDRSDGLVFLLLFLVFLYYTIGDVVHTRRADPLLVQAEKTSTEKRSWGIVINLLLFSVGLALLAGGGKIAVDAAVAVAELLHVPKVIIGLTIVAVGTSLPELVTSVVAAFKGQSDIAIGNVVGSNIFNLLLINGLCAAIAPIPVPKEGGFQDLLMMLFLSLLLLPLSITDKKTIVRWEGALLLILYTGFTAWRVYSG